MIRLEAGESVREPENQAEFCTSDRESDTTSRQGPIKSLGSLCSEGISYPANNGKQLFPESGKYWEIGLRRSMIHGKTSVFDHCAG